MNVNSCRKEPALKLIKCRDVKAGDFVYLYDVNYYLFVAEVFDNCGMVMLSFDNPTKVDETYLPFMLSFNPNQDIYIVNINYIINEDIHGKLSELKLLAKDDKSKKILNNLLSRWM